MELLTVLNDYNAKNREEIHLIPFFYFLFWLEINIIIFLFSWKLRLVGPVEQLVNLEWSIYMCLYIYCHSKCRGVVLNFGEVSRYCTWVLYFKDYNNNTDFRQKNKFKHFWWLAPQEAENGTFLENWLKKITSFAYNR